MSDKSNSGGPNVGLLLLIPAAMILMRAAKRHHRMLWDEVEGQDPAGPYRHHGRHRFAGPEPGAAAHDGFRLPPRIEWMLDTWHTRAHEAAEPADSTSA